MKLSGLWFFIILAVTCSLSSSTTSAGDAYYAYDDLGRLTTVIDDAGNTAIYNYDAVGNLLASTASRPARVASASMRCFPGKGR